MIVQLKVRIAKKSPSPTSFIATISIAAEVERCARTQEVLRKSDLFRILSLVESGGLVDLYYPVFVNDNHWITIHIDFRVFYQETR